MTSQEQLKFGATLCDDTLVLRQDCWQSFVSLSADQQVTSDDGEVAALDSGRFSVLSTALTRVSQTNISERIRRCEFDRFHGEISEAAYHRAQTIEQQTSSRLSCCSSSREALPCVHSSGVDLLSEANAAPRDAEVDDQGKTTSLQTNSVGFGQQESAESSSGKLTLGNSRNSDEAARTSFHLVEDLKGIEMFFWYGTHNDNTTSISGPRVQVICGRAGVGKTNLSLEYGAEQSDRYPDGIFFVDAPTSSLIREHCQNLSNLNEPEAHSVQEGTYVNVKRFYLYNLISYVQNHPRSLLILDDVTDIDSLPDELFSLPVSVHILITTRRTVHTHCRLENYRLIIKQSCTTTCLIDGLNSVDKGADQRHSTVDIDYSYGCSGVVVCSSPQSTVVAVEHNLLSISAFRAGPTFSAFEVRDSDEGSPWDKDIRHLGMVKRRFQVIESHPWRRPMDCEASDTIRGCPAVTHEIQVSDVFYPSVPEECGTQESEAEGDGLQIRGEDEDYTISVVRKILLGSSPLSDFSQQHGTFLHHLAVNLFGWSNRNGCHDGDGTWRIPRYAITTSWFDLPADEDKVASTSTDGSSAGLNGNAVKGERLLIQTRSFHSKNIQQTSNHPLITRLSFNVFACNVSDFVQEEDTYRTGLFSVASLLASLCSVGESSSRRVDSIPLIVVGVCDRVVTDKEKTEFETKVAKTLCGISSLVPRASRERLCYYLVNGVGTSDDNKAVVALKEKDDDANNIRNKLRSYAKQWRRVNRPLVEKELELLREWRQPVQRQQSMGATTYFSTLKSIDSLSEADVTDYFHEKGVVFYPPSLQPSDILLDLDWFCHKIDALIEACPKDICPDRLLDLASLKEKGIAGREVVDDLIRPVPEGSTKETLLRVLDHHSICLQPHHDQEGQPKSPYVESSVAVRPKFPVVVASKQINVVVPHRLPPKMPPIMESRTSLAPLAIRCKDREIPRFLFYQLAWLVQQRFPVGWQMARDEARFCVEHGHTLSVMYKESFMALTMRVRRRGLALPEKTGVVCDEVRRFVLDTMASLKSQYRLEGLNWEIVGIVFPDGAEQSLDKCEFISGAQSDLSLDYMWPCFSDTGQDYEAPETLFLWFNLSGRQRKGPAAEASGICTSTGRDPSTPIQVIPNHYTRLCQIIDPHPVLQFLSDERVLSSAGADYCREPVVNGLVSLRLLRLLDQRGEAGGDLLRWALQASQQEGVVTELWTSLPAQGLEGSRVRETTVSTGGRQVQSQEAISPSDTRATVQQAFVYQTGEESSARPLGIPRGRGGSAIVPSPASLPFGPLPEASVISSGVPSMPVRIENREANVFDKSGSGRQSNVRYHQGSGPDSPRESAGRSTAFTYANIPRDSLSTTLERHSLATATPRPGLMWTATPENLPKWSQASAPPPPQIPQAEASGEPQIHPIFEAKYYHIERSTDGFNDRSMKEGGKRLGSGSFGTVYYGLLHSEGGDKFEVAIKRLKKVHTTAKSWFFVPAETEDSRKPWVSEGKLSVIVAFCLPQASSLNAAQVALSRKQFGTEMHILTRYVHRNIVKLIGFSSDGPELCLIYEYMQRGALSHRLDCKDGSAPLDWKVRISIAEDLMNGIDFLHNGYRQSIIHRDVKSSNVLVGAQWEAKLSDFGLAFAAGDGDQRPPSPGPSVGTRPYMSPEAFDGVITTKVDVYGYGVILYELATGLPPYSSKKKQDLKTYIDDIQRQHVDLMKMLDPKARFPRGRNDTYGLDLLDIAQRATIKKYSDRPSIRDLMPQIKRLSEMSQRR